MGTDYWQVPAGPAGAGRIFLFPTLLLCPDLISNCSDPSQVSFIERFCERQPKGLRGGYEVFGIRHFRLFSAYF